MLPLGFSAIKALRKEFKNVFEGKGKEYLDSIEYLVDVETKDYYEWRFVTPDNKKVAQVWRYYYASKKITKTKELVEKIKEDEEKKFTKIMEDLKRKGGLW